MKAAALSRVQRFLLSSLFVLATIGSAHAAAPSGEAEKQARALYERAEKSFDVGKFADALADYQAAYEAKPLPGFLFNIAQCYRNMGDFDRARFFFRRYLAVDPRAPNRRKVEELIGEMTKQIEAQKAAGPTTSPPPATTAPLPPPGASPPVVEEKPPVSPPVVAPPPAPAPALAPSVEPEPTPASAAPVLTTTAAPSEKKPLSHRWWFWTGLGAVVVGGAVAAFFLTRPETRTPGTLDPIDARP
jgi:tetratricopeptide (TPR) repeat protein